MRWFAGLHDTSRETQRRNGCSCCSSLPQRLSSLSSLPQHHCYFSLLGAPCFCTQGQGCGKECRDEQHPALGMEFGRDPHDNPDR